jgi:SanA protein
MKSLFTWLKRLAYAFLFAFVVVAGFVYYSNSRVKADSKGLIFHSLHEMPHSKVGLLLGTSKYNRSGNPNLFFRYRIEAAVELYRSGKIDFILVSGDNRTLSYNEPRDMRKALMSRGIPDSVIYLDFAGLRTFDSVVRCNKVFGQASCTIISQDFHLQRALYIAKNEGVNAIGFAAREVEIQSTWTTHVREILARTRAILDVSILNTQPKYLGEPVTVGRKAEELGL